MATPLVSVYIPTHNRPIMLERAIRSVMAQTYRNIEILVCDDGSSEETYKKVSALMLEDERIKYFRNDTPKGACAARNLGINAASGLFITGLDDDDEFTNERISSFVSSFQKNNYSYLCSGMIFDFGNFSQKKFTTSRIINLDMLLHRNLVGNQVFTKTSFLQSIGGFDEKFPAWQDYETWIRLAEKYGVGYNSGEPTYIYHLAHEMNRITTSPKVELGYKMLIKKHASLLSPSHYKSLFITYKIGRKEEISYKDIISNINRQNIMPLLNYKLKKILALRN